ncbi:MAG: LamG domain-containing protein [Rhodoferax sp.]|nr:LamG domain-containing protein [Rhodoferax sp.]
MFFRDEFVMRWLALAGLAVWFLCSATSLHAATYAYRSDTFAYDTPSATATSVAWHAAGTSPACTTYPLGDDDWADIAFPSGFTFTFGGAPYAGVRVYSNGILAFPTDNSGFHRDYTSQTLPISVAGTPGPPTGCTLSAAPVNVMAVYWLDIVAGTANSTTGASVQYELLGSAPNRRFVVSWVNVKLYNSTTRYNFQVVLHESLPGVNGNFKYQYTTGSSTGANAAVGVQLTTTDYTQYAFNQNFIDTTFGTTILWYPANQLAGKSAEYRFDEGTWNGTASEIGDTSGNSQNASRTTSAVLNVSAGKLCRGATFTSNISNATVDAVATPIVPASTGSVSFWYKSNTVWNAASSDRMLFDATTVAARPFFLMKLASGALRFALTDSAGLVLAAQTATTYTFAAATWHHIAVSWSLKPGTNQTVMQIMLDGVLVNTTGGTPYRTTSSGAIASMSTLYIGDNRTSGVTPNTGSPNGANGTVDEVYVYAMEINATQAAADMNLVRTTCTSLDHFHIKHNGEQVSCNGVLANVTIEAHDASHALLSLAGTTMQMSTSTTNGTWSSVTTINPVNSTGGGNGNYTFANEASVVLGLSNAFNESLNININSGGITEKTGSAATCVSQDYTSGTTCDTNLNFAESGFLFNVLHHVAEVSQSVKVSAVKKSDNSLVCTPAFASVSKNVTFTCGYANPATGSLPVRVGGKALNAASDASIACDVAGQVVPLAFDANGEVNTTVQYADVGNMNLNAAYALGGGITMKGTDTFVAAPKSFAFSAVTSAPIKAGKNFNATVTALNNAGAAAPNFGKESPPEAVIISFAKNEPTGANSTAGSLTSSVGAFGVAVASGGQGPGAALATLAWSEVGKINLTATLADDATTPDGYLGSSLTANGTQAAVGRFIPDHFDTVVTHACVAGGFTYSRQPFTVRVTAMNGATTPAKTQNYDGTSNTSPNYAQDLTLNDASAAAAGTLAPTAFLASEFDRGVATLTMPIYTFTAVRTAPTTIKLRAVDTDGVSSATGTEGTTIVRSGRARLLNAYGSELLNLPIPLTLEYWDGSGWNKNSIDTCTPISANNFGFAFPAGMGAKPNNLAACETALTVGGTAPNYSIILSRPGAGNNGWADLTLNLGATALGANAQCVAVGGAGGADVPTNAPWLQYDWRGAGNANPAARATFGTYRSPLIYRRENY